MKRRGQGTKGLHLCRHLILSGHETIRDKNVCCHLELCGSGISVPPAPPLSITK